LIASSGEYRNEKICNCIAFRDHYVLHGGRCHDDDRLRQHRGPLCPLLHRSWRHVRAERRQWAPVHLHPERLQRLLCRRLPHPTVTATIAGGASAVSIDLGDFGNGFDSDLLFLEAYNAANVLLGRTELLIPESFAGMKTLSLSFAGIDHVIFGSEAPSTDGSSILNDNFTFEPAAISAVPEPATWAMMLVGFFGLGAMMRRARPATA